MKEDNYIKDIEIYFNKLKQTIDLISKNDLNQLMNILENARNNGNTIFIMGNGGSATTASHFCCDFNKGISFDKKKKYKFICLNDNTATMMAYANDLSYEEVFCHTLKNFFQPNDVVIGISGSGNSKNVLKAIEYANNNHGITCGLTGFMGGKLKQICKYNVNIPINNMQITEDLHMVLDHCMMTILA